MTTSLSLSQALDLFLLEDRAPSTRETYRKVLRKALAFLGPERDVDLPTKEDLLRYIQNLRNQERRYVDHPQHPVEIGGLSPRTIQKRVKCLTAFFNWLQASGYREDNPTEKLYLKRFRRPPGSTKAATPEELQAILEVAESKALLGRPLHLAIFLFLCDTGSRAGEAASLTMGNLRMEERGAWVLGKGDKTRPVFFGEQTAAVLEAWLEMHPDKSSPTARVFNMKVRSLSQVINRMAKVAGITRPIGAHAIRHRVGQVWSSAKMGEQATQMKLGHDSSAITVEMYYNTTWDHIQHASEQLSLASIYGIPSEPLVLAPPNVVPFGKTGT
jgi:site-specific recombinase XerD